MPLVNTVKDTQRKPSKPPAKLYYVAQAGADLGYREKGGGLYTSEKYAESQAQHLRNKGATVVVYECEPDWKVK